MPRFSVGSVSSPLVTEESPCRTPTPSPRSRSGLHAGAPPIPGGRCSPGSSSSWSRSAWPWPCRRPPPRTPTTGWGSRVAPTPSSTRQVSPVPTPRTCSSRLAGTARSTSLTRPPRQREVRNGMRDLDGVQQVTSAQPDAHRSALLISVQLSRDQDDVSSLQAVTKQVQAEHPDLQMREAGDVSVDAAINDRVGYDLSSAEGISLPVTLILMLLAFGALIAAGIPVLLAATSVAATIGHHRTAVAPDARRGHGQQHDRADRDGRRRRLLAVLPQARARGTRCRSQHPGRRRDRRGQTSGHSILVSGGAVIASMAGLFVIGGATFNSLAAGAILVVAVAVLGSITVLPALLAKLGRWVDRPRVPLLWRLNRRIGRAGSAAASWRPSSATRRRRTDRLRRRRAAARRARGRHEDPRGQPQTRCRPRSPRCRPSRG